MRIGHASKNNRSWGPWLSFFYASLIIFALVWTSTIYLPEQFTKLRNQLNQTLEERLLSNTSELNNRLTKIENQIQKLGMLQHAVDLQEIKSQEQVYELRLESLRSEIAAHQATIQNLTNTISDYEDTIASLSWRKRQLDKAIEDAQGEIQQ